MSDPITIFTYGEFDDYAVGFAGYMLKKFEVDTEMLRKFLLDTGAELLGMTQFAYYVHGHRITRDIIFTEIISYVSFTKRKSFPDWLQDNGYIRLVPYYLHQITDWRG